MRLFLVTPFIFLSLLSAGAADNRKENESLKAEALFVWGYPLVKNIQAMDAVMNGSLPMLGQVGVNRFSHARRTMRPEDRFVSPNIDVLFSVAILDLTDGPIELEVPETSGQYYVLQFIDPWTNSFAYLGKRSTGTKAGKYLVVGPEYSSAVSEEPEFYKDRVIRSPQNLALAVLRISISNATSIDYLHSLQKGFKIGCLVDEKCPYANPFDLAPIEGNNFWGLLSWALERFTSPKDETELVEIATELLAEKELGTSSGLNKPILLSAQKSGLQKIESLALNGGYKGKSGWRSLIDLFNYNRSNFSIGTLEEPNWIIADKHDAFLKRALAARIGLWGNHGYEATFFEAWTDAKGQQLFGKNKYLLTLSSPIPAKAFWSVTNYSAPEFFLYENNENKYAISSYDKDLVKNADGSVTIIFSHDRPSDTAANWLPTPKGSFRPLLSIYQPDLSEIRRYQPDPIKALP